MTTEAATPTASEHATAPGAGARPAEAGRARLRGVLYLVFALSGLTALIYEATWTRYLQLFLGHAAYAQVLVLSLFMGGMAAGALFASRLARTRVQPLHAYAAIEAILGFAALAFHPVFDGLTGYAYASLLPGTQGSALVQVLQWGLASLLILPQSILLGMTFPLMSSAVLRLGSGGGGKVFAMLYFANSAGAVFGVLLAGFWLIEAYGLQTTMMAAGVGNLAVACAAWLVARRRATTAPPVNRPARGEGVGRWLLAFAFLTAAASFLYEIAWLRMLVLVQGASTHAFETMLSAFILGIALGGLWIRRRIEQLAAPLAALSRIQILMGLAALATLPAYHHAFDVMQFALAALPRDESGYTGYIVVSYLISAVIMVPASFFAGMTLPLLTFVLYRRGRGESEIGAVYGWNTLGSIAGIALGGLVLMPLLGLKNMLLFGAAVDIGLGLALAGYLYRRREMPAPRLTGALAALSVAALVAVLLQFELDVARMASGVFRNGVATIASDAEVVHSADGRTATVTLVQYRDGTLALNTNGKTDAAINVKRVRGESDSPPLTDEYTMALLGALPLAHAPAARTAAIIGHGSGLTSHVMLGSPVLERLDVIEIEPEMIRASRAYGAHVQRAFTDPRSRFHIEDARAFFARASARYDLIVSEPSNPWVSGVASLYTPEFYRQARQALAPGGLFVQWFHLYEIDQPLVKSIVRGIGTVFSDYLIYASNDSDMILVAIPEGKLPPMSATLFSWPGIRSELEYLDISTPSQLRLFRIATRRAYAPLLENGRLNTDYHPYLEFGAARARFLGRDYTALTQLARDPMPALEILSGFEAPILPEGSLDIGNAYPRFREVWRANQFANLLTGSAEPKPAQMSQMIAADRNTLLLVHAIAPGQSPAQWDEWFSALFSLSKPLIPNGGASALEAFLRSDRAARALRGAPQHIRDKVEFLLLVGRRDLERIRPEGGRLLAGPLQAQDPAFHAYVFVATVTACLEADPDPECRTIVSRLDQVRRVSPLIDLLRAHQAAWK